jgi:hypothetical protein
MSERHRREILRLSYACENGIDAYIGQVKALAADSPNTDQKEQ